VCKIFKATEFYSLACESLSHTYEAGQWPDSLLPHRAEVVWQPLHSHHLLPNSSTQKFKLLTDSYRTDSTARRTQEQAVCSYWLVST